MKAFVSIWLLALFIIFQISSEGFVAGTAVKTPNGRIPIDQLHKDNVLIGKNSNNEIATARIISINEHFVTNVVAINIEDYLIVASPQQLFYCDQPIGLLAAKDLKAGNLLINVDGKKIKIGSITVINGEFKTYSLSLEEPHTFFVSEKKYFGSQYVSGSCCSCSGAFSDCYLCKSNSCR